MLEVKNVSVSYGELEVLKGVSFSVENGSWLMVVGPNGAGKSTLANAISCGIPYKGSVLFEGAEMNRKKPSARARDVGILSQNHFVSYAFTVREVVDMGRYAYRRGPFSAKEENAEKTESALRLTGLTELADKSVLQLSGGELQRTFLAQLIAQDPRLMIRDEPTNHLDLLYPQQIFSVIGEWIKNTGRSVISVVHDLSLAKKYGTHALLLNGGKTAACGQINEVLTQDMLLDVYSIDVYEWMRGLLEQWK